MSYGGRYARCWFPAGHGRSDLVKGIMLSCDVYFYQVGIKMHLKKFVEEGTRLGFQKKTGIDLGTEVKNIFPDGLDFWKRHYHYAPYDNEVMSLAIGQGAVTMTPLKMAQIFVGIARGDGSAPAPRLARTDSAPPTTMDLHINPEMQAWLMKGMRRVVGPGGTAQLTRLRDWDFMGKTGSAQACGNCSAADHAWFVGMGGLPGHEMEIVAAMFIQNGHHGWVASDYVANAINFYLGRRYGKPFEPVPTPRQRFAKGLYVDTNWLYSPVVDPIPGVGWPQSGDKQQQQPGPRIATR
jgi:penicillin-binding protein 2